MDARCCTVRGQQPGVDLEVPGPVLLRLENDLDLECGFLVREGHGLVDVEVPQLGGDRTEYLAGGREGEFLVCDAGQDDGFEDSVLV